MTKEGEEQFCPKCGAELEVDAEGRCLACQYQLEKKKKK